jgi:NCAIR mutase (PurE)-related protein
MNPNVLKTLLESVADGKTGVTEALSRLRHVFVEDIGYAHIDHHRTLRKGFPEVIYGAGKSPDQIEGIMEKMVAQENVVLVTRLDAAAADPLCRRFPEAVYHADAGMLVWQKEMPPVTGRGEILVLTAGTSDVPVAREALLTARAMGNRVSGLFDVGVAGIHRLFSHRSRIENAAVIVVVAGMEGALPSVVAGMVGKPVIGVPTSVGYGVSMGGLTALFAMLNSCSSNVAVVNIDNGFGAGYLASVINRR